MSRYLDPKSDIVFKKIFGQHPHLLKSFLNAVLPLPEDGLIDRLEYLSNEQAPRIPSFKYTVVDVRCTDQQGRVFLVEMQIQWTTGFMQRMLFNASKAYVSQLSKGEDYHLLQPVYGLGLLNTEFDSNENDWYHHYKIVNVGKPEAEIKDLQLVFIELPKFKAKHFQQKKLQVLWLRFMSELSDEAQEVPQDCLANVDIKQAIDLAEEAAYTSDELAMYDKYWDAVSIEKTLMTGVHEEGRKEGRKEGKEEGITIGLEKGKEEGITIGLEKGKEEGITIGLEKGKEEGITIGLEKGREEGSQLASEKFALRLLTENMTDEKIALMTDLPIERVKALRAQHARDD